MGHRETCRVYELGLETRRESRGDGVFTKLACTLGKSLEPVFVIQTDRVMIPTLPTLWIEKNISLFVVVTHAAMLRSLLGACLVL
jgi:hypothetical protein